MTTRDELIEAGYSALDGALNRGDLGPLMGLVVDAVEPLIRGDERGKAYARLAEARGGRGRIADLRAKVEALRQPKVAGVLFVVDDVVSRADVLALFDGSAE